MLGLLIAQILFIFVGTILFLYGEFITPLVLMCVGCYVIAALLQIVIELKDINKKFDKFIEKMQ